MPGYLTMKIIFDGNIFDKIVNDLDLQELITLLAKDKILTVIVTRTIAEELMRSPFNGVPEFIPTEYMGNTVGRCGIMAAGDSIGSGNIFDAHKGNSNKINDALIADAADRDADYLISDDKRLRKRLFEVSKLCKPLSFGEFLKMLKKLKEKQTITKH